MNKLRSLKLILFLFVFYLITFCTALNVSADMSPLYLRSYSHCLVIGNAKDFPEYVFLIQNIGYTSDIFSSNIEDYSFKLYDDAFCTKVTQGKLKIIAINKTQFNMHKDSLLKFYARANSPDKLNSFERELGINLITSDFSVTVNRDYHYTNLLKNRVFKLIDYLKIEDLGDTTFTVKPDKTIFIYRDGSTIEGYYNDNSQKMTVLEDSNRIPLKKTVKDLSWILILMFIGLISTIIIESILLKIVLLLLRNPRMKTLGLAIFLNTISYIPFFTYVMLFSISTDNIFYIEKYLSLIILSGEICVVLLETVLLKKQLKSSLKYAFLLSLFINMGSYSLGRILGQFQRYI